MGTTEINLNEVLKWLFSRYGDEWDISSIGVVPIRDMDSFGMALTIRGPFEGEITGGDSSLDISHVTKILRLDEARLSRGIYMIPIDGRFIDQEVQEQLGSGHYVAAYVPFDAYIFLVVSSRKGLARKAARALARAHSKGTTWVGS